MGRAWETPLRNAIAWLVLGSIFAFGFCSWQSQQPDSASQRKASPKQARLGDIAAAYRSNEIAADLEWKGVTVASSGVVVELSKSFLDEPFVTFRSNGVDVLCNFRENQVASLARFRPGDTLRFTGEVAGLTLGSLIIRDCWLNGTVAAREQDSR